MEERRCATCGEPLKLNHRLTRAKGIVWYRPCAICMFGNEVLRAFGLERGDLAVESPPIHPNARCTIAGITLDVKEWSVQPIDANSDARLEAPLTWEFKEMP